MAATGKPKRYTERLLLTLEPQDLSRLNELAEAQNVTRLDTMRALIRTAHTKLQRRAKAAEENDPR